MPAPTVFISYSHKDEVWKDRLGPHLRLLEQQGQIKLWDDRMIDGGASWYPKITDAMRDAAVAVCLISAHYLASDFVNKEEIPFLLKRRESAGMLLLPVLVSPCLWEAVDWLTPIQLLPRDGESIEINYQGRENEASEKSPSESSRSSANPVSVFPRPRRTGHPPRSWTWGGCR